MSDVSLSKIESIIYVIRDQKIMLDSDLAELYEVETSQLTRQVRRYLPIAFTETGVAMYLLC
jgi:hypothetical protein